jgi:hypothetical protein
MVGPLGGAAGGSDSSHHRSCRRHQWRAPWGVLPTGPEATTTEGKGDVDGGLPRGAASGSSSGHHQSCKNVDGAPLGGATGRSGSGHQ